ncbi:MAG: M28 family peptidase [Halobacteriota archaeon]
MARLPDDVVGDAHTSTHTWDLLRELTAIGDRMGGHEGERAGASVIRDSFERFGLRGIEVDEFEIPGWWRGDSSLAIEGRHPRTFDGNNHCIALPGSPSGVAEGDVVDVGYGVPADFDGVDLAGKIVLASSGIPDGHGRWVHRNEKYARAVAGGAVGFCFQNHEPGCLPRTGFVGFKRDATAPIPAVGLSYEAGYRLRQACESDDASVTLSVECRNEQATSQNVEAVVGPDTEQEILVTAHVDCHDIAEGAGDNGCGSVIVAEIGRLLAAVEDRLETRVRIVAFGAEENGMFGSDYYAETHDPDGIKCVVNHDAIGDDPTLKVNDVTFDEPARAYEQACRDLNVPIGRASEVRPHGDHWSFVQRGITSLMVRSGGYGRYPHAHTATDTLDKIDGRTLRTLAVGSAGGVLTLAEADRVCTHKPPAEIRDAMYSDYEQGLRVEDRWPFE